MIIKFFEEKKIDLKKQKFHLLYGENQGQIDDFIDNIFKKNFKNEVFNYEESEIIKNVELLFDKIQTKSFFENKKLILIRRTSDKITNIVEKIIEKKTDDVNFVLVSSVLDKKSKLRSFFEKDKKLICIPFYKDTDQSLINLITKFCLEKKINLSRQLMNLVVKRSGYNRQILKNELQKIEAYSINRKEIYEENILKLINLSENHEISTLIDNCLIHNEKRIKEILNENNFSIEECIQIIRFFLIKSKKLLVLSDQVEKTKSIDEAIASAKPPIFWKDKEIIKKQLKIWTKEKVKNLIIRINNAELLIKKNSTNSINILLDFILNESFIRD